MVAAGEHLSSSRPVRRAKTRPAARIPLCVEPPPSFAEGPGPGRDWWEKALSEKSFSGPNRKKGPQNQGVVAKSRTTNLGPFGEVIRATGPMAKVNPFRFSTIYQDDETDLICYPHRSYNSSTGRWLSRDPVNEIGFHLAETGQQVFHLQGTDSDSPPVGVDDDDGADTDAGTLNEFLVGPGGLNAYGFNGNNAIVFVDYLGLAPFCVCIRANGDHAWIAVTDLATGKLTTYGRWKIGYGHPAASSSGVLVNMEVGRSYSAQRCVQVPTFTPTINAGYNARNNNCATYAASEWKRVSGESLSVRGSVFGVTGYFDSPEVLVNSISQANAGKKKSANCCGQTAPAK
jgi:RHS repeat-associated protein